MLVVVLVVVVGFGVVVDVVRPATISGVTTLGVVVGAGVGPDGFELVTGDVVGIGVVVGAGGNVGLGPSNGVRVVGAEVVLVVVGAGVVNLVRGVVVTGGASGNGVV